LDLAADNGVPGALMFRNALYGVGTGNNKETVAALKKAAEFGNTYALTLLGMFYTFGDESLPKDAKKGAALLQQAIDQGSMLAHFCMALNKMVSSVESVFKREE
jgi:TPR repeat protein